jgi:TolB-like protein/Tfp pilus assembly protein PilF/tRNA A-37 threonylcarbamoyl transferase component Bud32
VRGTGRRSLMNKATAPSDSLADVVENPKKCPQCGATTQLNHGTCINCLLREGLEAKGESSREAFESVLAEANVTDTQWRLGHYEILEEIGRGGMGVIYRARQQHSRRIVAVKRIFAHEANSHETLTRFRREAEAVASLDHPNILPIHEVSESEEGLPFFSMKYAEGGSLRAAAPALRAKPRECVRMMAKVARAIAYAHGKGVLHRDLQPGNILLDENGEPMVSDFGLAKWLDQSSDLTRTLETLGTPGYIAPEQAECRSGDLTSGADIYSLGAILFYLLTGRPPFVGSNVLHVIHQAAATPAPRLRSLVPSLDRDLETVVARCLESDPNARYQSAGALADDLEHWLRHEPIRARRTGVFTRGQKWVRRNPTSAALVGSLIALGAAMGVLFWEGRSPRALLTANVALPYKSIAVLPFENLSADPENAFFADGVQDEILNDLARIADLKVISRTSVMQYKSGTKRNLRQIGNELGVAHVVEGRVQRVANRVRVTAQLIDAKTDTHLWVERYDRPLTDVFTVQSDIAKAIAGQLQAKLSSAERAAIEEPPTTNLIAYDRYLRAQKLRAVPTARVPGDMREIIRLLDQAIAHDPTFLRAYCSLASAHAYVYHLGIDHTPARLALAKEALDTAFRLGPDRGETHLAAAWVAYHCYRDYETALKEGAIARRGLPNDASVFSLPAYIARRQGHWEECARNLERAAELDPRNVWLLNDVAQTYQMERRFSEARVAWDRVLGVAPDDPTMRVARTLLDLESRADTQPGHEAIQHIVTEDPSAVDAIAEQWLYVALCRRDATEMASAIASLPPEGIIPWNVRMPRSFFEGLVARVRNDATGAKTAFTAARVEIEKIVRDQPDYARALCVLGMIDAALGRKEDALHEGRRAVELLPVTKDALAGAEVLTNLATTYAWVGERDLAIKQLEELVRIPSPACYGQLRLHPFWDPLRGDPRFEKLLEEAKKPVALESPPPLTAGIAVLPFENLSADPENAFFTDGVQDEILNDLAKIADLKVISRTSVMQYKSGAKRNLRKIASELGVAHVVEGSVQRAANRVRVSAQLIDARTDTHLWGEGYDRPLDDVFAIQTDIAKAIATQLQAKLSPSQSSAFAAAPTRDAEAYDLFLKGEYQERQAESTYKEETYDSAETFYRQALARDPTFSLAYARFAYNRLNRHWFVKRLTSGQLDEVKSDIERAIAIAPDLPDAHLALGLFHYWGRHDFDSALKEFDRAVELQPSNSVSRSYRAAIYRRRGEWRRSLAEYERAAELDPRDVWIPDQIGGGYLGLRRWSDAERWLKHALALDPHHLGAAFRLNLTYIASTGDIQRARRAWEGIPNERGAGQGVRPYYIVIPEMIDERVYLYVLERHFSEALQEWDIAPGNTAEGRLAQLKARIGIQVLAGQSAAAKPECEEARVLLEAELAKRQPEDRVWVSELAWIYVCLGRNADALRLAREAAETMPIEKDAILGINFLVGLAQIDAHIGRPEEAVKILRQLLTIPAGEYVSLTRLKIDPVWDPIRNDPDFQKLLSEPEPETVYK